MSRSITLGLLVLVATLLPRAVTEPVACTFSNPSYAGKCVERATRAGRQTAVEACRVILNCLNDTRCVKTYCQATTVRGGWTLESPKEKQNER